MFVSIATKRWAAVSVGAPDAADIASRNGNVRQMPEAFKNVRRWIMFTISGFT
jgi:hypothetical protein